MTRAEAILAGLTRYDGVGPCARGHLAQRLVSNKTCADCLAERRAEHKAQPRERAKAAKRTADWRGENPDRNRENLQNWRTANRPRQLELERRWIAADPGRKRAKDARARAARLRATPAWSETDAITAFYSACPPGFQVDHDIPLRGELVCGLHVIGNLQYLPASENAAKGNRWSPTEA